MLLTQEEILKRLKSPKNSKSLVKALEKEKEYKQFFYNLFPDLVYDKVKGFNIASKQFTRFKNVFNNHTKSILNKVVTHYKKVFSAHGKYQSFSFANINHELNYSNNRKTLFNGVSGFDWWEHFGHVYSFTEPSSVLVSSNGINVKRFPVSMIHDIEVSESGIDLLILKESIGEGKDLYTRFTIYDELYIYIYRDTKEGFEPETIINNESETGFSQFHGAKKCPAAQIVRTNADINDFIVKKSIIDDSIPNLYSYLIFKTFYESYKARGSFGTRIKAQLRCDFQDKKQNVMCSGGIIAPINDSGLVSTIFQVGSKCPTCSGNTDVMGEVVEIPVNMQNKDSFVSNVGNLFQNIEADGNILKIHTEDLKQAKNTILTDMIGEGFGVGFNKQAQNDTQILASFDDQESNLDEYKSNIEFSWNYIECRAAEQFAEDFESLTINLGGKYFLKTKAQLLDEQKLLKETTSNDYALSKKQFEIFLTDNKNNQEAIDKYHIVQAIKPYAGFDQDYVKENREYLLNLNPNRLSLYYMFNEIMSRFELEHGDIGSFGKKLSMDLRIKRIKEKFNEILLKENGKQTSGEIES